MMEAKYAASRRGVPACSIRSKYNSISHPCHPLPPNTDMDTAGSIDTFTTSGSSGSSGISTSPRTAPHCRPTLEERSTDSKDAAAGRLFRVLNKER